MSKFEQNGSRHPLRKNSAVFTRFQSALANVNMSASSLTDLGSDDTARETASQPTLSMNSIDGDWKSIWPTIWDYIAMPPQQ